MSSSSAAFFLENFAGTVSVFAGAPAKAPLTNTAFSCGLAFGVCELGSSAPILPDGVCCAFSCCDCCCASAGGVGCWAAARPMLPTNRASAQPGCPSAGGRRVCSGAPPPPASRSSPCATPAGGFSPAPSAMGHSGCSGATGARPPGTVPPDSPPVALPPNARVRLALRPVLQPPIRLLAHVQSLRHPHPPPSP